MNALEISHLSKRLGDFALADLNLTLPSGCILGLVGENGAGKSTTLRLIMDAIPRDSGHVSVLGADNRSPAFLAIKEDIGVVLDESFLPGSLTIAQTGKVFAGIYRRWDSDRFRRYLTDFGLPEKKRVQDLSRGMKMKLAIAAALSHSPRLLLLDEATSGLDPIVRDEILNIFSDFTREPDHSILLSSHITSDLEKICDYIAFLHEGRLVFCEEKDALLERYGLLVCSEAQRAALPQGAVFASQAGKYGVRCLVRRAMLPPGLPIDRVTLDDILLFFVKEGYAA